jgi:hypothetical protein
MTIQVMFMSRINSKAKLRAKTNTKISVTPLLYSAESNQPLTWQTTVKHELQHLHSLLNLELNRQMTDMGFQGFHNVSLTLNSPNCIVSQVSVFFFPQNFKVSKDRSFLSSGV